MRGHGRGPELSFLSTRSAGFEGIDNSSRETRTIGYEPTRETAMAAFKKSWRRE